MPAGRPQLERVSSDIAKALRERWRLILRAKAGTGFVERFLDGMPATPTRCELPMRSRRWLERARDSRLDLARRTAIEVVLRFRRLRVLMPEGLCEALLMPEPAVLVFPGAGAQLAERVLNLIERGAGFRLGRRTRDDLARYCSGFENLARLEEGRHFVARVKSVYGKSWQWQLTRIRHLQSVRGDGVTGLSYTTASTVQLLENEFRRDASA